MMRILIVTITDKGFGFAAPDSKASMNSHAHKPNTALKTKFLTWYRGSNPPKLLVRIFTSILLET